MDIGTHERHPGWRALAAVVGIACLLQACAGDPGPLLNPGSPGANQTAPDRYRVLFETSSGDFTVDVHRDWAPRGADRFYNLVSNGFYDNVRFFRVIRSPEPFMAQFGIHGEPQVAAAWSDARIPDDPVVASNTRGRITFATAGPNTRTSQVFINYADNSRLDALGFAPFGEVTSGMEVVDALYADYGEGAPQGSGPDQASIEREGTAYLESGFPRLDYIRTARLVE
jgi:peptidyl-prolyl cis-trans isomerase A (cyclophilin A)